MAYSPPSGYPLHQISTHPDVTFYDEPQEKKFTSRGGHFDFNNGVEVTVPPDTIKAGSSVNIKVQPSLAPKDVFVMPQGIQSASPSYLLSSESADMGEIKVTVTMEHHVRVETKEEADDLLFLQANSSPKRSGSKYTYEYQEVPESRSEFIPGENKGSLTPRYFTKKFFKIGLRNKLFSGSKTADEGDASTIQQQTTGNVDYTEKQLHRNLYTVRVYRSPSQTTCDRMAIICVSLFGRFYTKFLEVLDKELIPRDYPEVSTRAADRTTIGSLQFTAMWATLNFSPIKGWSVEADKKMISKAEADQPETADFEPEDIHDYPPKIVCRFYPEENAGSQGGTFIASLTGMEPNPEVSIPLKKALPVILVDTTKLQEASMNLHKTIADLNIVNSQLGVTVRINLSLTDHMTLAIKSTSLGGLVDLTESIQEEVKAILTLSRRVAEECTIQIIRENIIAGLAKMETLSHQLWHVMKVRIKLCAEETLPDVVEGGVSLLDTVDSLLKDMQTLSGFASMTPQTASKEKSSILEVCQEFRLGPGDIDKEITEGDNYSEHLLTLGELGAGCCAFGPHSC